MIENMNNSLDYINERIDKVNALIYETKYYGAEEKNFYSDNEFYQKQLDIVDKNMPKESLTYTIFNFLSNENNEFIKGNLTNQIISHEKYDHIAMECLILENLLDFGMIASLYEIPNMQKIDKEICDVVVREDGGAYHLFEMFHKDAATKYAMINTFVKFISHPELRSGVNLSYLSDTKYRLRYEYTEAILYCKAMTLKKESPKNNKMDEIDLLNFLVKNKKGREKIFSLTNSSLILKK